MSSEIVSLLKAAVSPKANKKMKTKETNQSKLYFPPERLLRMFFHNNTPEAKTYVYSVLSLLSLSLLRSLK